MKKTILLTLTLAWMLPLSAIAQFETVWMKKLENGISSVTFSHNSKWIMAWLSPNIKIFDVETGELVNDKIPATLQNPFFSLDDTHIYGIENNRIAYYNLETGLNESTAKSFDKSIVQFTVSKDFKYFLGTTKDSSSVGFGVWDMQTGELLKYKKIYEDYDRMDIDSTDFAASCGQIVLDCNYEKIFIKEFTRNRRLQYYDYKGHPVYDTKYQTKLKVYDFSTLDSINCLYNEQVSAYFGYFVLSNDCLKIAFRFQDEDNGVIIYDINTMQMISKLSVNGNVKMNIKFTSDDQFIVTATSAGADVWETSTGNFIKKVEGGTLYTLDLSNDMKLGATSIGEYLYIFKMTGITSVPQEPENTEIVYPNPTDGNVMLRFNLPKGSELSATIANMDGGGSSAMLFNGYLPDGENTLQFNINQYTAGTYFITLNAAEFNKIFKVMISR